jgi:hypothetical protein
MSGTTRIRYALLALATVTPLALPCAAHAQRGAPPTARSEVLAARPAAGSVWYALVPPTAWLYLQPSEDSTRVRARDPLEGEDPDGPGVLVYRVLAEQGDWITLEKFADLTNFVAVGALLYPNREVDAEQAYRELSGASKQFEVYRRANFPQELHYDANPRSGDPIILPTGPYSIRARQSSSNAHEMSIPRGVHGYDPRTMPAMKAIFFAAGPDIRSGVTVPPFENVNVYPLIARILGLQIGPIDGKLRVLQKILK